VEDAQDHVSSPLQGDIDQDVQKEENSNGILAIAETHGSPKRIRSKRSVNFRKKVELTDRQQREANLGTILVCISLLFILCQSIKIIPDVSDIYLKSIYDKL